MEPMTLGSPVGSPVQTPGSPGSGSSYLPSFLLGEANPAARLGLISPQGTPRNNSFTTSTGAGLSSPNSTYTTPDYRTNRQKAVFGNVASPNGPQIGVEGHTGGPPTRGLFDTLDTLQPVTPYTPVPNSQSRLLTNNVNNSIFLDCPANLSTNEPAQGLLQWITVFGFPLNTVNAVLSHVSSRVRIVDKHGPPHAQGNWIHLKCASEQEAQRALACNGNIVSGTIMIGVIPCTDEGVVMGSDKENLSKMNASMRLFSTPGRLNHGPPDCNNLPRTPVRIQNARPLAAGYNQHLNSQSVRSPENIPQKSTGLVSKAMEYVFGW